MANSFSFKDTTLQVGDSIAVDYRVKESDDKERIQQFKGILIAIKGETADTRMITVRKISKSGIGVERIFPINSPFIDSITVNSEGKVRRTKLYYLRQLRGKAARIKKKTF